MQRCLKCVLKSSIITISAEPLTLQQFTFFQDELKDGLSLHIHLRKRKVTCEAKKRKAFFITLDSFCRQRWETDATSVTGPGTKPKYVCQVQADHWGETLLASINWRFAGNPCSSHSFWNKLEAFRSETQTNSHQKSGKHWNSVFNRSTTSSK